MIHTTRGRRHCVHCGETVSRTATTQCANSDCITDFSELPVWPWNKCAGCGERLISFDWSRLQFSGWLAWLIFSACALVIIAGFTLICCYSNPLLAVFILSLVIACVFLRTVQPVIMVRLIWQPLLGLILLLIGIFGLSKNLLFMGLTLTIGWVINRFLFQVVRGLKLRGIEEGKNWKEMRDTFKHNPKSRLIPGSDQAAKEKYVKDCGDKYHGTQWRIMREKALIRLISIAMILIIMVYIIFWGPGNITPPWKIVVSWIRYPVELVVDKAKNSKIANDTEQYVNRDEEKAKWIVTRLESRGLNREQRQKILDISQDYSVTLDLISGSKLRGDSLYQELSLKVPITTASKIHNPITKPLPIPPKSYWQKLRMHIFEVLLWLEFFGWFYLGLHMLYLIFATIGHAFYVFSSEMSDRAKLLYDRAYTKKLVDAGKETPDALDKINKRLGETGRFIFIDVIMELIIAAMKRHGIFENI